MTKVDILDKAVYEPEKPDDYPTLNIGNNEGRETIDWTDLPPEVAKITEATRGNYETRTARRVPEETGKAYKARIAGGIAESEAARISAEAARIVVKAMAAKKAAEAKVAMKADEVKKLRELASEAEEALKVAEAWFARMAAETEDANPVTDKQARNAAEATGGIQGAGMARIFKDRIVAPCAEDIEPALSSNITSEEFRYIEKYLEVMEHTNNDLQLHNIGAEEAIKRLREIILIT